MPRKRKKTRSEKRKENPHSTGQSKYALKVQQRRKLAIKLGKSPDTPLPILQAIQADQDAEDTD